MTKKYRFALFLLYFVVSSAFGIYIAARSLDIRMLILQVAHGYVLAWLATFLNEVISRKGIRLALNIALLLPLSVCFIIDIICLIEFYSGFSKEFVTIILGSNPDESQEFLRLHFRGILWSFALLGGIFLVYFLCRKWRLPLPGPLVIASAVLLIPCLILININPDARRNLIKFNSAEGKIYLFLTYARNCPPDYTKYIRPADLEVIAAQPENIVLIFGESHCRSHCQFNGYDKTTMPRMQEILEDAPTRLFAFENVSSPGITTSESFKSLMTTYRPEYQDSIPFYTCQTLIQVMREAGYRSIWVSNQSKRGFSDNVVGNFADLSDTTFFNGDELSGMNRKSPDEELLPVINRITEENKTGKYFYVIHLMGSHPAFRDRYPEAFDIFKEADYPDRIESQRPFFATYDNSLLYTDYIISRIFEAFKEKEAVIIYLSDHGLDFFMSYDDYCAHAVSSSSPSARFAREVPFLIYTSDTYREHFPTVCERIRMSTDREYRTDSLIYTVMDFAGVVFRDSTACGGSILQADSCR